MPAVTLIGDAGVLDRDHLFCYGTLMTGFSRRPLLGPATLEGEARIRGALYDFGEYPGIVLDEDGGDGAHGGEGWVLGELYRVPDLAARLPTLDAEEWYDPADPARSLYVRREAVVQVAGAPHDAWIYVYNPAVGGSPERGPRIESGDWRVHVTARHAVSR
jgi:gamma-glutamylcyclotransferase (GGCT)/AIG2-like uncharacterized protein YtfP